MPWGLCGAPGRFIVGWLIDRFGRGSIRFWYVLAFAFEILGLIILTQASSLTLVWAFAVVFGIGQGMTVTTPLVMIANYFGSASYSAIYSTRLLVIRIANVIAPLFAAWVYDTLGSYLLAFYIAIVLLAIMMVIIIFATPPKTPIGAAPQQVRT